MSDSSLAKKGVSETPGKAKSLGLEKNQGSPGLSNLSLCSLSCFLPAPPPPAPTLLKSPKG